MSLNHALLAILIAAGLWLLGFAIAELEHRWKSWRSQRRMRGES